MGNIGPEAILPILESKAVIMKNFAGIDALPLALRTHTPEEFVSAVLNLGPTFGAICIEDVASPAGLTTTYTLDLSSALAQIQDGVTTSFLPGIGQEVNDTMDNR